MAETDAEKAAREAREREANRGQQEREHERLQRRDGR